MFKYIVVYGHLHGSCYYKSKEEAIKVARLNTYTTGVEWIVKRVLWT